MARKTPYLLLSLLLHALQLPAQGAPIAESPPPIYLFTGGAGIVIVILAVLVRRRQNRKGRR